MKKGFLLIFVLIIMLLFSFSLVLARDTSLPDNMRVKTSDKTIKKLIRSKKRIKRKDLLIKNWNPPTSLTTHFGWGTIQKNSPVFNFNLNLGYLRFYMKSDSTKDQQNTINSDFSYIVEIKPFDFASFVNTGSSFSIYVERNDWLRNLTFMITNKTYSSTQLITADMLWYFEIMYNGLMVQNVFVSLNSSKPTTALDYMYTPNRKNALGLSDRIHLYKSPKLALGILGYFEFLIPKENEFVGSRLEGNSSSGIKTTNYYSSAFTYAVLGGFFFRMKNDTIEINSKALYQRMEGIYDGIEDIELTTNTVSLKFDITIIDRYFIRAHYYGLFIEAMTGNPTGTQLYSHTILLGGDIRGFGPGFEWLGIGLDTSYQIFGFDYTNTNTQSKLTSINIMPNASFYPLSIHKKNHTLRLSFIYALLKYDMLAYGLGDTPLKQTQSGWNQVFMGKIDYVF